MPKGTKRTSERETNVFPFGYLLSLKDTLPVIFTLKLLKGLFYKSVCLWVDVKRRFFVYAVKKPTYEVGF